MRIEYIGHALPSRMVANEDIAALIRQHSVQFALPWVMSLFSANQP